MLIGFIAGFTVCSSIAGALLLIREIEQGKVKAALIYDNEFLRARIHRALRTIEFVLAGLRDMRLGRTIKQPTDKARLASKEREMDSDGDLIAYLVKIVPDAEVECAGCPAKRKVGEMVSREEKFYHSAECADRSVALYRKPQPKGVKAGGYMDV